MLHNQQSKKYPQPGISRPPTLFLHLKCCHRLDLLQERVDLHLLLVVTRDLLSFFLKVRWKIGERRGCVFCVHLSELLAISVLSPNCINWLQSFLYQLIVEFQSDVESEAKRPQSDEYQNYPDQLEPNNQEEGTCTPLIVSLHALQGSQGPKTMVVVAQIGNSNVIILVDAASTHNFVNAKLARQLNLRVEPSTRLQVTNADGGIMFTQGVCRSVQWQA